MRYLLLLFLSFCIATTSNIIAQTQIGADIDGEAGQDESGTSVALSANGKRVAIGAPWNGVTFLEGRVRVYEENAGTWIKVGNDIDGEAFSDQSGISVSLSADGTIVAIGAPKNEGNGFSAGHVRVYHEIGGIWSQMGADLDAESSGDEFGKSVSLSSNGNRLAIGGWLNSGGGANAGHVQIYEFNGTNWIQLGVDIDGEAAGDFSGNSVSLSSDGTRVAIGAWLNGGNGVEAGQARIFEFDGTNWLQVGSDIDGEAANTNSGFSVSLSGNGTRVAVGAPLNNGANGSFSGHTRVFEESGGVWSQLGTDIDGEAGNDQSGFSVSLSADGARLAVGAWQNNAGGSESGHVRLYDFNGSSWIQLGNDIDGESAFDNSGFAVSLAANGTRLAIGAPKNDGTGAGQMGQVRVYGGALLPVDLLSFYGKQKGDQYTLYWETVSEQNNAGFELEKSVNTEAWNTIGFIEGKGTSSDRNYYLFEDKIPYSGISYYRLKQIDFDGRSSYSDIIQLVNGNSDEIFQIYPNPSNKLVNLEINNPSKELVKIMIMDNLGKVIREEELTDGERKWNTEIKQTGIYIIQLSIGRKTVHKQVVVK